MRNIDPTIVNRVLDEQERFALLCEDALVLLYDLPDEIADAVITDPPYNSGGAFRADRQAPTGKKYCPSHVKITRSDFTGDSRDQRSFERWCIFWMAEALRITKPSGVLEVFTDWRQLAATIDAVQMAGWVFRGVVPWNKTEGTRPQKGRFMAQCEYVVWASKGPLPEERGVGCLAGLVSADDPRLAEVLDLITPAQIAALERLGLVIVPANDLATIVEKMPTQDKWHQAGKPIPIMLDLVELVAPGGLIVDPFMGSGSTGVAGIRKGYRFLGSDIIETNRQLALERITAELRGLSLPDARAGQQSLFGTG